MLYHHEKWDGTGYPEGLKGLQIPTTARIFALVDVLEALLSERTYKKAMPFAQAKALILNGLRSQFDPKLLQVFEEMTETDLLSFSTGTKKEKIQNEVSRAVENLLAGFVARRGF